MNGDVVFTKDYQKAKKMNAIAISEVKNAEREI
jgi:hypothetical protein